MMRSAMPAPATYFATALDQVKEDLARRGVEIFDFGVGDPLDPEPQVLPASGCKEAIFHTPLALLDPDDGRRRLIYPSPSYPVYDSAARFSGAVPHSFVLDQSSNYELDLASLPRAVLERTRFVWLNYPHNPTGASVSLDYLRRQVEIARDYDILVCADECYLDLYFDQAAPP